MIHSAHIRDKDANGDLVHDTGEHPRRRRRLRRLLGRLVPGGAIMAAALVMPELSVGAGDPARGERLPDPLEPAAKAKRERPGGAATAAADAAGLAGVRYAPILELGRQPAHAGSELRRIEPGRLPQALSASAPETSAEAADLVAAPPPAALAAVPAGTLQATAAPDALPLAPAAVPALQPSATLSAPPSAAPAAAPPPAAMAVPVPPAARPVERPAAGLDPAALSNLTLALALDAPRPVAAASPPAATAAAASAAALPVPPSAVPADGLAGGLEPASLSSLNPAPAVSAPAPSLPAGRDAIEQPAPALVPAARSAPTSAPGLAPAPPPVASTVSSAAASAAAASPMPARAARSASAPDPAPPAAVVAVAPPTPALGAPAASAPSRIADLEATTRLVTRVDGKAAGMLDFQQTPEGLKVRLGGVAEVLADRYDAATLARIRSSAASQAWFSLAELQAKGVPISYAPVYDEFNIGQTDTRPKAGRKVHIDQIGTPERGPRAAAVPQVPR